METSQVLSLIRDTGSPLKRQLMLAALVDRLLREKGLAPPVVIGGCALAYYSREVYVTADLDLACADREALDEVLTGLGFERSGRYWVDEDLGAAIEAPAGTLPGEDAPLETVELEEDLTCRILGIEDLLIDRLNACKHLKSIIDCEMAELLIARYREDLDWTYLGKKGRLPENNTWDLIESMLSETVEENEDSPE